MPMLIPSPVLTWCIRFFSLSEGPTSPFCSRCWECGVEFVNCGSLENSTGIAEARSYLGSLWHLAN